MAVVINRVIPAECGNMLSITAHHAEIDLQEPERNSRHYKAYNWHTTANKNYSKSFQLADNSQQKLH